MFPKNIIEIVVVEGVHDMQKLQSIFPGIDCIVTGGSEISDNTIDMISTAFEKRGVILFMDPDYPGRQITHKILEKVPECKIAFIAAKNARSKNQKKVGIEHATPDEIIRSLDHLFSYKKNVSEKITRTDLASRGLIGEKYAANKRLIVTEALKLPPCNGKTFLKLANMFGITKQMIDEVIK